MTETGLEPKHHTHSSASRLGLESKILCVPTTALYCLDLGLADHHQIRERVGTENDGRKHILFYFIILFSVGRLRVKR